MLRAVFETDPRIHIIAYEGLTVNFCKSIGAAYMIRGIRTVSDFEYEKAIAQMNHSLDPEIESIFIVSKPGYSSISSSIVREIMRYNGDVSQFIPKEQHWLTFSVINFAFISTSIIGWKSICCNLICISPSLNHLTSVIPSSLCGFNLS